MQTQIARLSATLRNWARRLYRLYRTELWSRGLSPGRTIELVVGWPLLLLPAILFSQIVTPNPVWVVLLVSLVLLYVAAFLWVWHQTPAVTFDRRRQGSVLVAGDRLREDFVLVNASRLPVLWAEFADASDLPGYAPGTVVAAPVGGDYRWWKEAECAQRGVFRLGPHSLRLGDPFGLFVSHIEYDRAETVLIYPRVVQLPQVELPRGSAGGSAARRRPLLGVLPAASVREYVQGDSMRHIHWPSTAHRTHLMVKELELEPSGDVWIVLNLDAAVHRGEGRTGTLEYAIILAASMAAEMVTGRERRAVGLLTASGGDVVALPPQPGQAQLWAIMAALAPAQPTTWPLEELLRRNLPALGRRHTLIVITPGASAVTEVPAPTRPGTSLAGDGQEGGARALAAATGALRGRTSGGWIAELVQAQRLGLGGSVLLVTLPADEAACLEVQRQLAALEIPAQVLRTDMALRAAITYRRTRKVIRTTPTGGAYTVEIEEEVG